MSEKISWERAVQQDVWIDKEYGKLLTTLEKLEESFSFDSKVISDIYGDGLLDSKEGERILNRWQEFLSVIKDNVGNDLLISSPPTAKFAGNARYALVPSISLDEIDYQYSDGANPSEVKLICSDKTVKASLAFAKKGKFKFLQAGSNFELPIARGDTRTVIDIADPNMEFIAFSGYGGLLEIADAQSSEEDYSYLRTLAKDTYYPSSS